MPDRLTETERLAIAEWDGEVRRCPPGAVSVFDCTPDPVAGRKARAIGILERTAQPPPMCRTDDDFRRLYADGMALKDIAMRFGRGVMWAAARRRALGLPARPHGAGWRR